jgi:hypothetical protein
MLSVCKANMEELRNVGNSALFHTVPGTANSSINTEPPEIIYSLCIPRNQVQFLPVSSKPTRNTKMYVRHNT